MLKFIISRASSTRCALHTPISPINCVVTENNTLVEVRNYLGEKYIRRVQMLPGVTVYNSAKVKDELILEGNDIEAVSKCGEFGFGAVTITPSPPPKVNPRTGGGSENCLQNYATHREALNSVR